jgi:hypothetical protein
VIEFLTDNNDELVVVNPEHIVYVRNDGGTAILKMSTNETFILDDYNGCVARLRESGLVIHLDKEAREAAEEIEVLTESEEE